MKHIWPEPPSALVFARLWPSTLVPVEKPVSGTVYGRVRPTLTLVYGKTLEMQKRPFEFWNVE
eukprot:2033306-Pleurochrysis_carterae.AAC.1